RFMVEVTHPEITVTDLLAHMNREAPRPGIAAVSAPDKGPPAGSRVGPYIWDQITAHLQRAEQHAYMGRSVPKFQHFAFPKRRLARWLARVVLYVAKVFTKGQQEFNVAAVNSVRDLADTVRQFEQFHDKDFHRFEQVHQERLHELITSLHNQETAIQ